MNDIIIGIDVGLHGAIAVMFQENKKITSIEMYNIPTLSECKTKKVKLNTGKWVTKEVRETLVDGIKLFQLLQRFSNVISHKTHVMIEHVSALPNFSYGTDNQKEYKSQRGKSNFTFGEEYGMIKGFLIALGLTDFIAIRPVSWKNVYGLDSDKSNCVRKIKELYSEFPQVTALAYSEDGKAEALWIASYMRDAIVNK